VDLQQANSSDYATAAQEQLLDVSTGSDIMEASANAVSPGQNSAESMTSDSPASAALSAPLGSEESHAAIVWLYQELSNDILEHVKSSSFLDLVCLAYFLGAQEHLAQRLTAGSNETPLIHRLMSRLGYSQPYQEKLDNCRRLLNNNSLLRQFFLDGRHSLSCHLEHEPNIQNSLQQIVRQYAHYSLMDLHQFNVTLYNPQPQSESRHLELPPVANSSNALTYIVAILLFFLLSGAGSYALLRFLFPEVLQNFLG